VRADLGAEVLIGELERTVAAWAAPSLANGGRSMPRLFAAYARSGVDVSALPLQHDLVDYLRACAETGREIHLVTSPPRKSPTRLQPGSAACERYRHKARAGP